MWDIFLFPSWAIVNSFRQVWERYVPQNCMCSVLHFLRKSWARFRAIFWSLGAPCHGIHPIRSYQFYCWEKLIQLLGGISATCSSREESEAESRLSSAQATPLLLQRCSDPSPNLLPPLCCWGTACHPMKDHKAGPLLPPGRAEHLRWMAHCSGLLPHTGRLLPALPHLPQQHRVPPSCSKGSMNSRIARLDLSPLFQTLSFAWKYIHLKIIMPINQFWKWFNPRCERLSSQTLKAATSYSVIAAAADMNTAEERCFRLREELLLRKVLVLWSATRNGMPALQPPPKQGFVDWAVHLMVCPPHREEVAED